VPRISHRSVLTSQTKNGIDKLIRILDPPTESEKEEQFNAEMYMNLYT
jgi:hypothetical protein